jgi:PAS domain S-box-containing protein
MQDTLRGFEAKVSARDARRTKGRKLRLTGRKLADSALALVNDRLRLAMESSKSVGWDWDVKSGRNTWFGDLRGIFGIPSETYSGRVEDFHRRIHPDDRERVGKAVKDAMNTHGPYAAEFRILRPDGTVCWVAAKGSFYYLPGGEPERMLGIAVDVTERKRTEEGLRLKEMELLEAQRLAQIGSWEWDPPTGTVTWSQELYRIAGLDSSVPPPSYNEFPRFYTAESWERLQPAVENALRTGASYELDLEIVRPDATKKWIRTRGETQCDTAGHTIKLRGTAQDITERKLAEEALSALSGRLIEAQERERARIARDLHDDIGQQLALLANNLAMMEQDLPDSIAEIRNRVSQQLKRVHGISSDVQAMSHRLHSSKLRYLGIVAAANAFCRELADQHKVEIGFTHLDVPPKVPAEISLCLFRVMQEALHNSVKHSGARRVEVELRGARDGIHLTVHDAGLGFDRETAATNRGLGLVSMQERVNLVKGAFSIDSGPGRGTTIHARLPLSTRGESARAAGD